MYSLKRMSSNHLYYRFKPYLPWHLRMAIRRIVARKQRRACKNTWPINEAAGRIPKNWPGWPDGKKFALALTHDVESSRGLGKCRQLMELELKLGFRSSFNFIPEGDYRVARELRDELIENGFEVGVHDLRHDGKLYWKSEFPQNARSINRYLKEWSASGFRSGFMFHNREHLNELDIQYDASTFDTDPFEPQPDGVNTIFPFWVPRPNGGGYVELPYTLPQDSTLFIVLREKSPDIWKKKLAWIVEHGGMALINVHPDYLGFKKNELGSSEYPAAWYEGFLNHIIENYKGDYWNALPRNLAGWYKQKCVPETKPQPLELSSDSNGDSSLKGMRAAVVLYSYYESDPRPRREAEALNRAGMEVDVISLRQDSSMPSRKTIEGINVFYVPLKRRRASKSTYVVQYSWFLISSFFLLSAWSLKKRYQLVHIHNMPDFLVFSGLVPRLRGAKIILDLHDPMPELMMTIFGLQKESAGVRLLKFLEKVSIGFAHQVLTVNLACKNIFSSRSCESQKIQVVMNAPDENIFKYRNGYDYLNRKKKFVIMFHGSIVERHGLDLAVEALQIFRKKVPDAELRIYGAATPFLDSVMDSVQNDGLKEAVRYLGNKSMGEIAQAIHDCDVGVIPNRQSIFTEINTPTRIFEYLAMGKPVIAPLAPGITDYFGRQDLVFFELGNADDLAEQLNYVYFHPDEVKETIKRGQSIYRAHSWNYEKEGFINRVEELLSSRI
ncbi:MAG: glycosyltransferase [Limisphaerales bacterium]